MTIPLPHGLAVHPHSARAEAARGLARALTVPALVAGDAASYGLAALALAVAGLAPGPDAGLLALAATATMALYRGADLYPGRLLHDHEQLRRRAYATLRVAVILGAAALLLAGAGAPLGKLVVMLLLGLALQPLIRGQVRRLLHRAGAWAEPAAIVAPPDRAAALAAFFARNWQYGIQPQATPHGAEGRGAAATGTVLLAGDGAPLGDELDRLRRRFARVILLADLPSLGATGLQPRNIGGAIGICLAEDARPGPGGLFRRAFDLAVALPALVVAAPILAGAALAIRAVDPGPVIYRQAREGLNGRVVRVFKLRSMYQDADRRLEALLASDPAAAAEWQSHFKLRDDPRILPGIGRLLRASSLDEVPQLFNIILGEMSVVGPRPFPDYHLAAMPGDFRLRRRSVMPGLTGLWQITARSDSDLVLQQQLDDFYIQNRSFWLDLQILLGTVRAVLGRGGAY